MMEIRKRISFQIGLAGSGKSTAIAEYIANTWTLRGLFTELRVLAPTHNAVENIREKVLREFRRKNNKREKENIDRDIAKFNNSFKTVHSFYRINWKTNEMLGLSDKDKEVGVIIIDEFSLINREIFDKILKCTPLDVDLILIGDPLQLNSVYLTNSPYYNISFNDLEAIDVAINFLGKENKECNKVSLYKHIHQSTFFNYVNYSNRNLLKYYRENKRHNEKIYSVLSSLKNLDKIEAIDELMENKHIEIVPKLNTNKLINKGFSVIGATYGILQGVYDNYMLQFQGLPSYVCINQNVDDISGFKQLHLYEGCPIRFTETNSDKGWYNGQRGKILRITQSSVFCTCELNGEECDYIVDFEHGRYPFGPENIFTIHKAQGYTIDNVLICIDNMFELTMMYTAITRAANAIAFYTNHRNIEKRVFIERIYDSFNWRTISILLEMIDTIFKYKDSPLVSYDKLDVNKNTLCKYTSSPVKLLPLDFVKTNCSNEQDPAHFNVIPKSKQKIIKKNQSIIDISFDVDAEELPEENNNNNEEDNEDNESNNSEEEDDHPGWAA